MYSAFSEQTSYDGRTHFVSFGHTSPRSRNCYSQFFAVSAVIVVCLVDIVSEAMVITYNQMSNVIIVVQECDEVVCRHLRHLGRKIQ